MKNKLIIDMFKFIKKSTSWLKIKNWCNTLKIKALWVNSINYKVQI